MGGPALSRCARRGPHAAPPPGVTIPGAVLTCSLQNTLKVQAVLGTSLGKLRRMFKALTIQAKHSCSFGMVAGQTRAQGPLCVLHTCIAREIWALRDKRPRLRS